MEMLTGNMKETKNKTLWTWIKKYKKQIILWIVIIMIAVPLIVYVLSEVSFLPVNGGNDWAGFWGGYIGAIIGGLCTVVGVTQTIKHEREKEEVEKERSVLPYMGLLTLKTDIDLYFTNYQVGKIKKENCYKRQGDYRIQQYVFLIDKKKIDIQDGLNVDQIKNKDFATFIPLDVENVGKGAAIGFRVGVHKKETRWNEDRYTTSKHIKQGDSFNIFLLFKDASQYRIGDLFYLRILYKNIFSQGYLQEYQIKVEENHKIRLDLTGDQKRIIKS